MLRATDDIWKKEEIATLIKLWPTRSALQISKEMGRSRSAICAKAARLRKREGVDMAPVGHKVFEVAPDHSTRKVKRVTKTRVVPPAARRRVLKPSLPTRLGRPRPLIEERCAPCSIRELNDARCKWPLGPIAEKAVLFCGATKELRGVSYCRHHCKCAFVRRDH